MDGEVVWLDDDEQMTWRAFHHMRTQLAMALRLAHQLDSGISEPEYEVLAVLSEQPAGELRARELRFQLQWEKSRLAHQIRRMEERGLVTRAVCPDDPRAPMVTVTDEGLKIVRDAAPAHVARVRDLFFDPLTQAQLQVIREASEAIMAHLGERSLLDR
ncbi:MarR family winged helix-turn-helix transcriptional regulator [Amycolatopsis jiangsuensis]|uniref:DNA-binding MarR family transcriptional regulator n=1 Tax=Amycolatopsis jiangsuensis TaxID=1181879 RepID=A0A840J6F3_9PSEU|nr:MarR family transcriptional regulator [Amycolatopsis jiangsuensis]MBB4689610.1 DNA-binding MarR family transcriptional regulator [Amycolatopsis jiangsuensis]